MPGPSSQVEMCPLYFGSSNAAQESIVPFTLSVRYRTEEKPQSQGRKYCLPLKRPMALKLSGTLSQFASFETSISSTMPSST